MKNQHPLIICAAVTLLSGAAMADETPAACQGFPDVPVTIDPVFDEPVEDYTRPQAMIQQMASRNDAPIRENLVYGLASYQPVMSFEAKLIGAQYPNGQICGHVAEAKIVVGWRNTTIHVANEIPAYSCGFLAVLEHERRHIAVAQELLNETLPVIQQEVAEYLKMNGVFQGVSAEYAKATINEKAGALINSILTNMSAENHRRQQQVDTEEEYKRLTYTCNAQLAHIAARQLGRER